MNNNKVLDSYKEAALSIPFGNKQKLRLVVRKLIRLAESRQLAMDLAKNIQLINNYMVKYHDTQSLRLKMQYWNIMIALVIDSIDEMR